MKNLFLLPALIAGLGAIAVGQVTAQAFTILHNFHQNDDGTDATQPYAGLILSRNTLYGTTQGEDAPGLDRGTVFAVNTDGTGFATLHGFSAYSTNSSGFYTNSDGFGPYAGLTLSGNTLYGTAPNGGDLHNGTVFAVNTDGTGFTNLHSFTAASGSLYTNSDGVNPGAGLILVCNTLYGTAYFGGSSGNGTVFKINTDGLGFTTLHSFTERPAPVYRNSDGANPSAGLILSGNTLYGTAYSGGLQGGGTVFAVHTDGTGFTTLHSFTYSVGARPYAGLLLSRNTLYGTTLLGGISGGGTVFSLSLPPPPQLTITRSVTNVILTWPAEAAAFILQSTTNVVSPAVWSTVSRGPVVVNGQNTMTVPVSGPQNFYRLSQ